MPKFHFFRRVFYTIQLYSLATSFLRFIKKIIKTPFEITRQKFSLVAMLLSFGLLSSVLPISTQLFAQEYLDIESNNIRIDPEWSKTYASGENIWAYDVKSDIYGNIYSTGYFHRSLKIGGKYIAQSTECSRRCPDTYFLMKHDINGKLLWIRYANGNSRPSKIVIDKQGDIFVAGSVFSKALVFTSIGTTTVKLDKPNDFKRGIFIAKYDPSGRIIKTHFFTEGNNEHASDFVIDNKGNIYIAGGYQFESYDKPSLIQVASLLMKFNPQFEFMWKQVGDTIGRSNISSIFIDEKANIYLTASFTSNIRFWKTEFLNSNIKGSSILAKFNEKGKLLWAIDSIGKIGLGSGQGIVGDKKENVYVSVGSLGGFSIMKINKSGKLQWINRITGKISNNNQKMIIDDKDNVYLCGEGYGAVFGTQNSELFSYKSIGSTDFYIAKYNSKGECIWLKAGGGKGTDYCKSISLYKNDLFAFGWFSSDMSFNKTVLKNDRGDAFWLAKFDLNKLEEIDNSLQETGDNSDDLQEKYRVNEISCECYQYAEKRKRYIPPLNLLIPDDSFSKMTGWKYIGKDNIGESVFSEGLRYTSTFDGAFYSMVIIAYEPIRLIHPDNTFALNLTPCANENNTHELPVHAGYKHLINKYIPGYDYKSFDKSAQSYFKVLLNMYGGTEEEILNKVLFNYEMTDIQPFISTVNSKYNIEIELDSLNEEETISNILSELERKNIDFSDFILTEFILTDSSHHTINDVEKSRMYFIFSERIGNFTFENIDSVIYPQVTATITTKNIGIEINENVIRRWDAIKNEPAKDQKGKFLPANILADITTLNYTTSKGIEVPIKDVCVTRSEIAGTSILLNFTKAQLCSSKEKHSNILEYSNYPLFITDSVPGREYRKQYVYDSLLTGFTGLMIQDGTLNIPFKNRVITVSGSNIILNNKFISGSFKLPIDDMVDSLKTTSTLKIPIVESFIETTMDELDEYFKNIGLKDLKFVRDGRFLKVFFKKTTLQP